jgi:hypothetical protein
MQSNGHSNIPVSQTAIEAVVRDICNGETWEDFFAGRYNEVVPAPEGELPAIEEVSAEEAAKRREEAQG